MIEKMTRYNFILLSGEQEVFLQNLQGLGVVDITRSTKPVDDKSTDMLEKAEELKKAKELLEKTSFEEIQATKVDSSDPAADTFEAYNTLRNLSAKAYEVTKEIDERKPWGSFDSTRLDSIEALGYKTRFYKVAKKSFSEEWASIVPLQIVQEDEKNVWFVTVSDDPQYNFPIGEIARPKGNVDESLKELESTNAEIAATKGRLLGLKSYEGALSNDYSASLATLDRYLADHGADKAVENHITIFEGFAPSEEDERLAAEFDKMDMLWYKADASVEDNPPIKLKGNKFTSMFAVLTDMYGRPEYNGFDPTPYISIFFLLFFAFCMGDAGYGIVVALLGLGMKKMESFKSMSSLVTTLGIGTIIIGLIFHTFFSMDMLTWNCIPDGVKKFMLPSKIMGYDGTMVLAIIVGIFHLCVAMVVKTIYATKQKGFVNSLGTWGWTLLIVGGVIVAGIAFTGVLSKTATKWIVIVLGILSAIGIYILNDIHRNPLKNIGSGLWETYNTATGLLGDVLSYLRLYALGLAGAMLGQAFNSLGGMALGNGGIANWIFCILILVVGHVLNMAMAALGAFVHPLRLNFLEFFKNSGYEISGRNYKPLTNKE